MHLFKINCLANIIEWPDTGQKLVNAFSTSAWLSSFHREVPASASSQLCLNETSVKTFVFHTSRSHAQLCILFPAFSIVTSYDSWAHFTTIILNVVEVTLSLTVNWKDEHRVQHSVSFLYKFDQTKYINFTYFALLLVFQLTKKKNIIIMGWVPIVVEKRPIHTSFYLHHELRKW